MGGRNVATRLTTSHSVMTLSFEFKVWRLLSSRPESTRLGFGRRVLKLAVIGCAGGVDETGNIGAETHTLVYIM